MFYNLKAWTDIFVGPDFHLNCLQKFLTDNTSRLSVNLEKPACAAYMLSRMAPIMGNQCYMKH